MELEQKHIEALNQAEATMFHWDFCPYLELKEILTISTTEAQRRFRLLFSDYYGLDLAGLSDHFKDEYFKILLAGNVLIPGESDFATILKKLYCILRKQGDHALQLSFVSKLVAIHCEASPIYDRRIQEFFHEYDPGASVDQDDRIRWFIDFLQRVSVSYTAWAGDARVIPIMDRLKKRDARLAACHPVRLMDFLVWKVGSLQLLR